MGKVIKECEYVSHSSSIGDRFSQIRLVFFANSNRKFAKSIDVDERGLSSICNGKRKPGHDMIDKVIERLPEVSKAWLAFGEGDMMRPQQQSITGDNNTQVAGDGNNVSTLTPEVVALLTKKDEQIDRLIPIIESMRK